MTEETEKYFKEDWTSHFTLISSEQLTQLVSNPSESADGCIVKVENSSPEEQPSWLFKNLTVEGNYFAFDMRCSSTWSITFENCYFQGAVLFDEVKFTEDITFKNCYFDGFVTFSNVKFEDFNICECNFKNKVTFLSGEFNEVKFSQYDTKELAIYKCVFKKFIIGYWTGSVKLNKLVILNNSLDNGNIEVSGIDELVEFFAGGVVYSNILIDNVKCRKFTLNDFTSMGQLKVIGLSSNKDEGGTDFSIWKSNINISQFYRLDLASFTEVNMGDVKLMDATFINTVWPADIFAFSKAKIGANDMRKDDREAKTNEFKTQQLETYRQLKFILAKQGDKVQEQIFYAKEMNLYNNLLKWKSPFNGEFWDKLILILSSLFSNYGTNFGKALFWFLLINYTVFASLMIIYGYGDISFSWDNANSEAFWNASELFIKHLNPLHHLAECITGLGIVLDFIGRILSSYLIYHLIRTSRRFVR